MYNTATINLLDEYRIGDTASSVDDIVNKSIWPEEDPPEWELRNFKISNSIVLRKLNLYREFNKCQGFIAAPIITSFFLKKPIDISTENSRIEVGWGIIHKNFGDINDLIFGSLKSFYCIRENDKVIEFITNNFDIISLLFKIPSQLKQYFEDELFVLDIFSVPEEENWEQLIVKIQTKASVKEARNKLKKFRNDWWFEASEGFDDKLFVHIEYI